MAELRVLIETDRYDDTCAFYARIGMTITSQWTDHGRGTIFAATDCGRIEVLEGHGSPPPTVAIEIGEPADALHDRLHAAGVATSTPRDQPWGHRSFTVEDPIGTTITFFEVTG